MPAFLAPASGFIRRHNLLPLAFMLFLGMIFLIPRNQIYRTFLYLVVIPFFLLAVDRNTLAAVARSWVWRFAALLLLYMWLTVFWGQPTRNADYFNYARRALAIVVFITITAALVMIPGFKQRLFRWLIAVAAVTAIVTVGWVLFKGHWYSMYRFGAFGFSNANVAGAVYGVLLVGGLFYLVKAKSTPAQLWLSIAALIVMTIFIILTKSRGNWLALILTLALLMMLTDFRIMAGALAIVIAAGILSWTTGVFDLEQLLVRGDSHRLEAWLHFIEVWRGSPWLGVGVNYDPIFYAADGVGVWHAHNIYLAYLAHGGVPALILLLLMLGAAFRTAFASAQPEDCGLLAMLVFICLHGMIDFGIFIENADWQWLATWLPIGLIAGTEAAMIAQRTARPAESQSGVAATG